MRYSEMFLPTGREVPSDAELISHQLMIRAGLIRKLTGGIYSYLPFGYRAIRKVEADRPGGDEPGRRPGGFSAHGAAGGTLAGVGPLGPLRQGTAPLP